jgi:hypothetical protein
MPEGAATQLPSTLPIRSTLPVQSAQPELPVELPGTQFVAGGKRNRDGESGSTEPRKKRQSEAVPEGEAREPEGRFNSTQGQSTLNRGQDFLAALFAVVSTNRLLRKRWKLKEERQERYELTCRATGTVERVLEDLERVRDLHPVDQELLDEIAKYQTRLRLFVPERDRRGEEFHRLSRVNDALEIQIGLSVDSLFAYGEDLKDEEPLQILANNETFWMFFEACQMASAAAETAKAQLKTQLETIAEEQLAVRHLLESRFECVLAERLKMAELKRAGIRPSAKLAEISDEDQNELLKRLSDLELQRDRLTYDESSRESRDGIFRSRQLLKFAERAFIDAGLLEIDDDAGLDQEEQYATAYDAVRSGESVGSMVPSHLAASRMEMSEDERSAETRPTDPANLPDLATQLTLEEMITSRLAAAE